MGSVQHGLDAPYTEIMLDPSQAPATLAELAQRSFVRFAERPCLGSRDPQGAGYHYLTYGEVAAKVRALALGLRARGLQRGYRVAILSESRPEWGITDLACQMAGLVSVPIFPSLPSGQVAGLLADCGATAIVVENAKQLKKLPDVLDLTPQLRWAAMIEGAPAAAAGRLEICSLADIATAGMPGEYESLWPAVMPEDLATIIYTSGTTGVPRGVMLTHRNLASNAVAISGLLPLSEQDVFFSFLPLAHVYERTGGFYMPLFLGASVAYCENLFTIDRNMMQVQPTFMLSVPRLYETIRDKMIAATGRLNPSQKSSFEEALLLAKRMGAIRGRQPDAGSLSLLEQVRYRIYDRAVYAKIRAQFGGRLRNFVCGGAPLPPELGALFLGVGLEILEGYGLTETAPVLSVNRPGAVRLGSTGEPIPGVTLRIADDGEILARGPGIMKGYWNQPEATAEVLDQDGWFHTGDLGQLEDNYLRITGRKKDLLVLANGKKVAPAPIELKLGDSPFIEQAVLVGDSRKGIVALLVPRIPAVRETLQQSGTILPEQDQKLVQEPAVIMFFRQVVDGLTAHLAEFERIKKIVLLDHPLSVEAGELTPTLKVKRKVVAEKYASLITNEDAAL